jgi:hypothetical protein
MSLVASRTDTLFPELQKNATATLLPIDGDYYFDNTHTLTLPTVKGIKQITCPSGWLVIILHWLGMDSNVCLTMSRRDGETETIYVPLNEVQDLINDAPNVCKENIQKIGRIVARCIFFHIKEKDLLNDYKEKLKEDKNAKIPGQDELGVDIKYFEEAREEVFLEDYQSLLVNNSQAQIPRGFEAKESFINAATKARIQADLEQFMKTLQTDPKAALPSIYSKYHPFLLEQYRAQLSFNILTRIPMEFVGDASFIKVKEAVYLHKYIKTLETNPYTEIPLGYESNFSFHLEKFRAGARASHVATTIPDCFPLQRIEFNLANYEAMLEKDSKAVVPFTYLENNPMFLMASYKAKLKAGDNPSYPLLGANYYYDEITALEKYKKDLLSGGSDGIPTPYTKNSLFLEAKLDAIRDKYKLTHDLELV